MHIRSEKLTAMDVMAVMFLHQNALLAKNWFSIVFLRVNEGGRRQLHGGHLHWPNLISKLHYTL